MSILNTIHTIYLRQSPRLPKIIALAVLLEHLRLTGQKAPRVVMARVDKQTSGDGVYQLDCGPNEYRDRNKDSELAVVMEDFGIATDGPILELLGATAEHNGRREKTSTRPSFLLNQGWGSLGFFTGCGWPLIEEVHAGHWRWNSEPVEGREGELVLDDKARPLFQRSSTPQPLGAEDFLGMCLDVIYAYLRVKRNSPVQEWSEGAKLKTISSMLQAKFIGSDLQQRAVSAGSFKALTISGYIRHLYVQGAGRDEIRNKLRPWLRLWEIVGDCYEDANEAKPLARFRVGLDSTGVAFDLTQQKSPYLDGNPLVHQRWLAMLKEKVHLVIVRRESGHTAVFSRPVLEKRMPDLANELEVAEPGLWFFQGGYAIYNGSFSRQEVPASKLPVVAEGEDSIVTMAQEYLL